MPNYVTYLNNYLQKRGQLSLVSYEETSSGPSNEAIWTVECKFKGDVKGTGQCLTKADAKQDAARQALNNLKLLNGDT